MSCRWKTDRCLGEAVGDAGMCVQCSGRVVPVWADSGGAHVPMQREDSLDT